MFRRLLTISLVLFLYGCAQPVQKPPAVEEPAAPPPPVRPAMQLVVLVSEDIPAYSDIARAIARLAGKRSSTRLLGPSPAENFRTVAAYASDEHRQFVSIGLNASVAAKSLTNRQVVFCQVFNHQDYALLSARHKGVSLTPSPQRIFAAWRALAPSITDVGVITGPGLDELIQTARVAARHYGITLHNETVNSDKEFQYAYKQMSNKVQGYWLLPDNRVLSGITLRDVMTFSVRNSKQVAVFNSDLLNLGGLFSASSDAQDIAQQVLERLEQGQDKDVLPGADIVYPDKLNLRINAVMAQRLNLSIPGAFKKYADAP
ncbi:MAG TPA: ABC transporter substrate binding protein [Gallionellaceae bacterium]|nr:ABC transporter substrate binding protein [Gallionellaceae bacterium]